MSRVEHILGVVMNQVGPNPQPCVCPQCNSQMVTKVEKKSSTKTHLIALLLCLCLCWPCVCVPYCVDSCLVTNHYCPSCGAFIGTYNQ